MKLGYALARRSHLQTRVFATASVIAATVIVVVAVGFPVGANARVGRRGATLTSWLDGRDARILASGDGVALFTFSRYA